MTADQQTEKFGQVDWSEAHPISKIYFLSEKKYKLWALSAKDGRPCVEEDKAIGDYSTYRHIIQDTKTPRHHHLSKKDIKSPVSPGWR